MSIVKECFYNVECDRCGKLANEELWKDDEAFAKEEAVDSGFIEVDGKHYCPDCYTIDDEDNIVVKKLRYDIHRHRSRHPHRGCDMGQ